MSKYNVTNPYFTNGTKSEQDLLEALTIESISIKGDEFRYIPRTLIAHDNFIGEDRLSQFNDFKPIEMYIVNVDGFEGQGAILEKFGLMVDQSATLAVARSRWETMVSDKTNVILPSRPVEGDLIYYPMTKKLFEIMFVQHENPFYQLKNLYIYQLQVELFRYSSERIDTGDEDVDTFEPENTYDVDEQTDPIEDLGYAENETVTDDSDSVIIKKPNPFANIGN